MTELLGVAVLGLGLSSLYALASLGLVLTYRGSGVVNFAQGAIGLCAAFVWFELHVNGSWPYLPALVVAVVAAAILGAVIHFAFMRPLRTASAIARTVVTLGLLITLQAAVILRYGSVVNTVPSALPTTPLSVGGVTVPVDRLVLIAVAAALTVALWLVYRFTGFGRSTSAVAEDQTLAGAVGVSPDVVAAANWALSSALAALAAILVAPIITLHASSMTTLVIGALAIALIAGFRSFPVAFAASVVLGVGQTLVTRLVDQPGAAAAAPFVVMIIVMTVRGKAIPLRDHPFAKQPRVGSGRLRPGPVVAGAIVTTVLVLTLSEAWVLAIGTTLAVATFLLSFVVLVGYVGQISLAQWPLAGFGAWVAGRLMSAHGVPFLPALVIGVVATVVLAVVIALPAVRVRGINLAIVTFGLGAVLEFLLFTNSEYTGGIDGTAVDMELFGWSFDGGLHPYRYVVVTFVVLLLLSVVVTNVRRGLVGRRMLAVRTNERAAAALGIGVTSVKLYGFALSAGIAAVGAVLVSFSVGIVDYAQFSSFGSTVYLGLAYLGGIGFLAGPLLGSPLAPSTIGTQFGKDVLVGLGAYLPLIGGIALVLTVVANQDGVANDLARISRRVVDRIGLHRRSNGRARPVALPESPVADRGRVRPALLEVEGLSVSYGSTVVLDGVSLDVRPGEVLGLIGPNGAGKTTLIDSITGFTRPTAGTVTLDGADLLGRSPSARARAGISRAFQSLELFEDLTALENIIAATDPASRACYVTDLLRPAPVRLEPGVVDAIREFRLEDDLDRPASDLPYGRRRLLAIARAVASGPSVLLLDEPAAGLSGEECRELARVVRRLADEWGMAVLLIEHDVEFVMETCDRLVVIDFGRVISSGDPAVVRHDPAVVEAYLGGGSAPLALNAERTS
ncbi:branched-chain amino acid ABC transporter permease/ATP-binding protein [Pseudonocardia ailaonensis]|uniref:Branched-chain amino acid ABC transporter permease/ATP-binding protein n=1 Tax=Pseudonocardia ailaonensis TaxID=367279 RepID=A0ABN2N5B4_9PSEU